jgi:hypothetical protein
MSRIVIVMLIHHRHKPIDLISTGYVLAINSREILYFPLIPNVLYTIHHIWFLVFIVFRA